MKTISSKSELSKEINNLKKQGKSIGFVPTMGALHEGHLSLVTHAQKHSDITVVSIFVNPTQFNNVSDLEHYPRTIESDLKQLKAIGCNIVFTPSEQEMYPEKDTRIFEFDGLDRVMEGRFREGHFNGVAQIVSKLFDAVQPNYAFFGEKDFQQLAIIRKMTEILKLSVEIIGCPIIREKDGLAMSSRNVRLTPKHRKVSNLISKTLFEIRNLKDTFSVEEVVNHTIRKINESSILEVEYFEIVDGKNLQSIKNWNDSNEKRGCIAVFAGDIRLIDNVNLEK